MKMKKVFLFSVLVSSLFCNAQDAHFSQFHMMPMHINPAMTGFHDGVVRVGAIYRNQWATVSNFNSSFQTGGGYVDASLFKGILKKDYFGVGGGAYYDKNGTNPFSTIDAIVNLAYSKGFGREVKHSIALGIGAEIQMNSFNTTGAVFSDGISEKLGQSNSIFDANVGLRYHVYVRKKLNIYAGFAYHHLLQAANKKTAFSSEKWYAKYVGHAGAQIQLNDKWNVVPQFLFMYQNKIWQTNLGAAGQFVFGDRYTSTNFFSVGMNARVVNSGIDAVIPNIKLDIYNFSVGLAYDINVSNFRKASKTIGAFEIGLGYVFQGNKRDKQDKTPCPHF